MSLAELIAQPSLVAGAILLIGAAASGVNLYATLGGLGLASRLNLIPALPPGLTGLENGLVISTAGMLLLVEALADREPAFAGMWHTLHALVKPVAAALLCLSALAGIGPLEALSACALAAGASLLVHAMRYGLRVARRLPDAPRGSFLWTLAEAVVALALLLPLRFTLAAVPTAAALLLLMLAAGPLGFRAFRLGVSAQRARLRSFLGEGGWMEVDRLPGAFQAAIPATPLGGTPPRAARAAVLQAPGMGRFQKAWLVSDGDGLRLLAASWRGRREVAIAAPAPAVLETGTWADLLEVGNEAEKLRILLLKDGPDPALVLRAIAAEPLTGSRVQT